MAKITAYRSDVSGELIDDEAQLARIRVSYADKRRPSRVIDVSATEAETLLGEFGHTEKPRGRKPRSAPASD